MVKRHLNLYRNGSTVMPQTTCEVDNAKRVFQVHWIDGAIGEVHSRSLTRGQVSAFLRTGRSAL